jgi:TonB family protein
MTYKYSASLNSIVFTLLAGAVFSVDAQTPAPRAGCPSSIPLRLEQIRGEIENKVPDDRIIALVSACHVDFLLDPSALDTLTGAGAAPTLMDTVEKDTMSRMTLAQAHTLVAALEGRIRENEAASNAERDAALTQLDADFLKSPQKAPRNIQFESAAAFNSRIDAADKAHANDRLRVAQGFAQALARKNQPLEKQIRTLKGSLYSVPGPPPTFVSNDPDTARLTAAISGEQFYFSVAPDRAKALYDHWETVNAVQRYDDDEKHTRYLTGVPDLAPVSGVLKAIVDAEERKKLETAAAAKAIADAFALNPRLIPGAWFDGKTGLLWTDRDNAKGLTWEEAKAYCQNPPVDGGTGWRLASINELAGLYDPNALRYNESKTRVFLQGGMASIYHIKGEIRLTDLFWVWSSTPSAGGTAMVEKFFDGAKEPNNVRNNFPRALCVGNVPATFGASLVSASNAAGGVAPSPAGGAPGTQGEWRGILALPDYSLAVIVQLDAGGSGVLRSSNVPATALQYSLAGNRITVTASSPNLSGGQLNYTATITGDQMTGTLIQSGQNVPLDLRRREAADQSLPSSGLRTRIAPGSPLRINGFEAAENLLSTAGAVYPPLAKMARIEGTVKLDATVGKDGKVSNLKLLSGPPQLVAAAMAAVKQWTYKPELLNGTPVEVITTINIGFRLSGSASGR